MPHYAVVDEDSVDAIERALAEADGELQDLLDAGYQDLDEEQPALAAFLASEVSRRQAEIAQSVGYFLAVAIYLAFREAFEDRLLTVDDDALRAAAETLAADEELRASDPNEVLESDDVVAMGQPVVVRFLQHHLQEAVSQSQNDSDLEDLDRIYRALLVEIIALTHAVGPTGGATPPSEVLA